MYYRPPRSGALVRPGAGGSKLRSRKKYGREGPKTLPDGLIFRPIYDVAHRGQKPKLQRRARSSAVHVRRSIRPHRHRAAIASANVMPARSHMRSHPTHMVGRERQRSRQSPPPTIAASACSAVVAAAHIRAATIAHARAGFRCFSRSLLVRAQVLVRPRSDTHVHCQ